MAVSDRDVNTRVMLFAGVLTPAAVAVGWLFYFALQAGWETLYGAALGAGLALAVHAVERYLHTARHEAQHGSTVGSSTLAHSAAPHKSNVAGIARAGAIMFTFVGIACEHLAKDLVQEMLRPCLLSTISLLPVGVLFASAAERETARESNPIALLGMGALLGLIASCMVALVRLLAGLPVEMWGTFGWWALFGVGFSFIAAGRGHSLWRPLAAVVIAIAIVIGFAVFKPDSWGAASKPNPQGTLEAPRGNWITGLLGGVGYAVDKSLRNPDVPSRVWIEAKALIDAHHAVRHDGQSTSTGEHATSRSQSVSAWGSVAARWCGCDEPVPPVPSAQIAPASPVVAPSPLINIPISAPEKEPASQSALPVEQPQKREVTPGSQALAMVHQPREIGANGLPVPDKRGLASGLISDANRAALNRWTEHSQWNLEMERRMFEMTKGYEEAYSRQSVLCAELRQGFSSGMVRSWAVMLLFAVGLGLAPMVEQTLRPRQYPTSVTRRNDKVLAWTLAALVVGGALVVRWTAPPSASLRPVAAQHDEP